MTNQTMAHIPAIDIVVADLSERLKEKIKEKIPSDPTKTMGLYSVVFVTVGAKYDLTSNVSVVDGMTNRTECTICKIDCRVAGSMRPSIIWVLFPEASIGKTCRKSYQHLYNSDILPTWTPILEITRQLKVTRTNHANILRSQFPIRPSAAKTIHRSQGDTLNVVVVDFSPTAREHMHYVGLSRLRNIDCLHILRLNENEIKVSPKVLGEMCRLRSTRLLNVCVPSLDTISDTNVIKILFQTVRSLQLHVDDVFSDFNVHAADINLFVETALNSKHNNDVYTLEGYNFFRNDIEPHSVSKTPYGSAVYVRNSVDVFIPPCRYNYNDVQITLIVINPTIDHVYVVRIYRSKMKVKFVNLLKR